MAPLRKTVRVLSRRALRSIVTLHGSSEAIALGTAIGVFVAFTPTVGFQMLIGALLATLVGANRPAAMIPAWITNPFTIAPIFTATYWLGKFFWPGPSVGEVYHRLGVAVQSLARLSFYEFYKQVIEFIRLGTEVFVPMFIGGVIVGGICGAIAYPLTLRAVGASRGRLAMRRKRRAVRIAERKGRRRAE